MGEQWASNGADTYIDDWRASEQTRLQVSGEGGCEVCWRSVL